MTAAGIHIRARRCRLHPEREAAARCPSCEGFFCRECVTDHEGRVLCLDCLRSAAPGPEDADAAPAGRIRRLTRAAGRFIPPGICGIFGLITVWFCFYLLGCLLILIPAEYHEHMLGGG